MTRTLLCTVAATCFAVTALVAQNPGTTTSPDPQATSTTSPNPQAASTTSDKVTATGCIERADQVTPSGASTTVDSLSFVLIRPDASPSSSSGSGATGTAGSTTTAPTDRTASPVMYRLDGDVAKLTIEVGHRVEIAGSLDKSAPTTTSPTAGPAAMVPSLKVESIKMIAETCPRR